MRNNYKVLLFITLFSLVSTSDFKAFSKDIKPSPVKQKVTETKKTSDKKNLEVKEIFEKKNELKKEIPVKDKIKPKEPESPKLPQKKETKPKEAPLTFEDKNINLKNDDVDVYLYSYLDKATLSLDLINMAINSPCSKSPESCGSEDLLAKAVKSIHESLKKKYPQSNKIISEEMIRFFLTNATSIKDKFGDKNSSKIFQIKDEIKEISNNLFKEKEDEIISKLNIVQNESPKIISELKTNVSQSEIPVLQKPDESEANKTAIPVVPGNDKDSVDKSVTETEIVKSNEKIVFVSERDGNPELYIMNSDGSEQKRLTENSSYDIMPSWSPDGTKILFVSERDGNPEIYLMNSDGSNQTRLTNNSSYDYSPSWSPDGTKIAFVSNRDVSQNNGNSVVKINYKIYVMNIDGSNQNKLFENSISDESPKWSPDGTRMLFVSTRDGNPEIYVLNLDGSNLNRLTNDPAFDMMPNWSPDGSKIVFRSDRDGNAEIYTMTPDGGDQLRLTFNPFSDEYPAWSPDGNKIIFVSKRDNVLDSEGILTNEIYTMNSDGKNFQKLTNNMSEDYYPGWINLQ